MHDSYLPILLQNGYRPRHLLYFCLFLSAICLVYIPYRKFEACSISRYEDERIKLIRRVSEMNLSFDKFTNLVGGKDYKIYQYSRSSPFIFISGDLASNTHFLGSVLGQLPTVNCVQLGGIIGSFLNMLKKWTSTEKERNRLVEAGVNESVLNEATAAFLLEHITRSGQPADRLCCQDEWSYIFARQLFTLFPKSQFIFIVRDGRAVAQSRMAKYNNSSSLFNETLYSQLLRSWNTHVQQMVRNCQLLSMKRCKILYYEQLILYPKSHVKQILKFLDIEYKALGYHQGRSFVNNLISRYKNQAEVQDDEEELIQWTLSVPVTMSINRSETFMLDRLGYRSAGYPPSYRYLDSPLMRSYVSTKPPEL